MLHNGRWGYGHIKTKKSYDVSVSGGTVIFVCAERVGILLDDYILAWVLNSEKMVMPFPVKEGQMLWVYIARGIQKVILLVENNGEKIEDLPKLDPIEV